MPVLSKAATWRGSSTNLKVSVLLTQTSIFEFQLSGFGFPYICVLPWWMTYFIHVIRVPGCGSPTQCLDISERENMI